MSGTETKPLHSILSWITVTIDKIVQIYDDVEDRRGVPLEFQEVYRGLPFIRVTLEKIKPNVKPEPEDGPGSFQDAMDHAMECQQSSLRLEAMFRRVLPKAGAPRLKHSPISRMDQYRVALDTYGDDFEVTSLLVKMLKNAQKLAKNFLKDMDAESDSQKLVDIEQALQARKASIPTGRRSSQIALSNWGPGTSNANLGNGSQYIAADQSKLFSATTQIFGTSDIRIQDPLEVLRQEKEACFSSLKYNSLYTRRDKLEEERAHKGTCDWLFESSQFQMWQNRHNLEKHNGVLWIKGKPGTGKSTLMMHNVTYCERNFKDHIICAHFFSARGDSDEKGPLGLWRSLVYQMLEKEPLLYDRLVPVFRKKASKAWTEDELRRFLRLEMESPQPRPFLFLIDALDECDDYSAGQVVDFLEQLSELALEKGVSVNICLSSRYYPQICLSKCIDLFVDQKKEHDEDIERYVRDKVSSDLSSIQEEIIKKAGGVFLWVVLVIAMLKKKQDAGRPEEIKDVVSKAPSGLDELFEEILNKDESNRAETILMFQLVLFAKRLLKPEELYFATIAGTQQERLGPWDQSTITEQAIRLRIRDSSRGLIEVLEGSNTVQFIHLSVNDFLSRTKRLCTVTNPPRNEKDSGGRPRNRIVAPTSAGWWDRLTSFSNPTVRVEENVPTRHPDVVDSSNNSITECCLTYLTKIAQSPPSSQSELMDLAEKHPFLEYSSTYILHHAEDAEKEGPSQEAVIKWLLYDATAFETFRSIHNGFERQPGLFCYTGASLIHVLAFHGHQKLLRLSLKKKVDMNAQFGFMNSAIQIAAAKGDTAIVSILLEHGANPNLPGGIYGNALQAASKEGHREIVASLLNHGARINAQGGICGTALQAAAREGQEGIVHLLLENGADVNTRAGHWGTALQAASLVSEDVAKMLLNCGADPHAICGYFGTALQAAARVGNNSLVTILIEKGVDVNARGGVYGSALQAATCDSDETTKLLLESGADASVPGGLRGSVLHSAAHEDFPIATLIVEHWKYPDIQGENREENIDFLESTRLGETEAVEKMIENGQDINVQGGLLGSALQVASWSDRISMVEKLLELGADVNLQGGTYGTALQAASARGNYEIVQLLVEKGADVNAQGGLFGNALQAAAHSGSRIAVEYLLKNGANINAGGGHWGTALQAASGSGHSAAVNTLLTNGADIQQQGGIYGTALQAAARAEDNETVEALLNGGADVNTQGGNWSTALQAASRGAENVTETLLKHGADANLRGGTYGSALNAAAMSNERDIMDLLIRHGADPNAYIWVWPRSYRWNFASLHGWLWSQSTRQGTRVGPEWKPAASGIIMSVCVLSFAGWRLWRRFSLLN